MLLSWPDSVLPATWRNITISSCCLCHCWCHQWWRSYCITFVHILFSFSPFSCKKVYQVCFNMSFSRVILYTCYIQAYFWYHYLTVTNCNNFQYAFPDLLKSCENVFLLLLNLYLLVSLARVVFILQLLFTFLQLYYHFVTSQFPCKATLL